MTGGPSLSGIARLACFAACFCLFPALAADAAPQAAACQAPVLTLSEAATLLRVDALALQRAAETGSVPGRRIGTEWRFDCATLLKWLQREPARDAVTAAPELPSSGLQEITGRGTASQQAAQDTPTAQSGAPATPAPIGEAPEERTAEDVFLRGNRLLLGRGDVVVDVGQFYTRRDSFQLAAVSNGVGLATLEQSAFTTLMVGRVGIITETELFASAAFSAQHLRQFAGSDLERSDHTLVGPAAVGVRRTMLREGPKRPDVVLSVSGQIPTSDLLPAIGGGIVLVKSIDPVVLFANANYFHPFEKAGVTQQPIDTIDISMGYGLGLNDATAISMAVSGLFARGPSRDTAIVKPPSVFSARFSVTTALGQGLYLEPSVTIGLSGPGQSFAFGITMPLAF